MGTTEPVAFQFRAAGSFFSAHPVSPSRKGRPRRQSLEFCCSTGDLLTGEPPVSLGGE